MPTTIPDFFNVNDLTISTSLLSFSNSLVAHFNSFKPVLPFNYKIAHDYWYDYLSVCYILKKYDEYLYKLFKQECKVTYIPIVLLSWFYPHGDCNRISFETAIQSRYTIDSPVDISFLSRNLILSYPLAVKEACVFASGCFPREVYNYTKYTYLPEEESKSNYNNAMTFVEKMYVTSNQPFSLEAFKHHIQYHKFDSLFIKRLSD